jgi:small subunit ribosomal protein S20
MANTAAAKKAMRAAARRTQRNRSVRSAVKTRVSKARRALLDGAEGALETAMSAISSLDRAAEKGILHPNNVARRKSRLAKRLSAQGAPAAAPAKGTRGKGSRAAGKAAPKAAAKTPAKTPAKKAPARRTAAKKA